MKKKRQHLKILNGKDATDIEKLCSIIYDFCFDKISLTRMVMKQIQMYNE